MNLKTKYCLLGMVLLVMLRIFFWYLARLKKQQAEIRSRHTSVFFEEDDDDEDDGVDE